MRNKSKFSLKRFIKTGRFNLPQTTLDKIEHYYYLRNELKLNDEVYNLIAGFVNFLNPRNVLDPYCGIGRILYSIKNANKVGYTLNPELASISKELNYNSEILVGDICNESLSKKFDLIATVPAFDNRNNYIRNFLHLINKKLNDNGNLLIILPSAFFNSSRGIIKDTREQLINNYSLTHIIDLPKSEFSAVSLKLLIINKSNPGINDIIFMPELYDSNSKKDYKGIKAAHLIDNTVNQIGNFWVKREELILSSRWDRNFHNPKFKKIEQRLVDGDAKKLFEIADGILSGKHIANNFRKNEGELLVIKPQNINTYNNTFSLHKSDYFVNSIDVQDHIKVREGDLIINSIGPKFKFCLVPKNIEGVINQNIFLISSTVNSYIYQYLNSDTGNEEFFKQLLRYSSGTIISKLYFKDFKNILVPSILYHKYMVSKEEANRKKGEAIENILSDKLAIESLEASKILSSDFILKGWDAKPLDKIGDTILDIGLYHNDKIVSFVEIKTNKNEIFSINRENDIIAQCQNSFKIIEREKSIIIKGCFVIIDYETFFLKDNQLEKIDSVPKFSDYEYILCSKLRGRQQKIQSRGQRDDTYINDTKKKVKEDKEFTLTQKFMLDLISQMDGLHKKIDTIESNQKSIKSDTSKILSNLELMMNEVSEIKSLTKNTNESIENSIVKIINTTNNNYNFSDIESYIPRIKEWFDFWNILESESKLFMPRSEYLYDLISESDFDDYSPYVLYYCKVIELELFRKIFYQFSIFLNQKNKEINELFKYDNENSSKRTIKDIEDGMMKSFKNKLINNDSKYSLGEMRLILDLLPSSGSQKISRRFKALKVLQELDMFINNEIGSIPQDLIKEIKELINKYRNPSAHVGEINKDSAKQFFIAYKRIMNGLIKLFDN